MKFIYKIKHLNNINCLFFASQMLLPRSQNFPIERESLHEIASLGKRVHSFKESVLFLSSLFGQTSATSTRLVLLVLLV